LIVKTKSHLNLYKILNAVARLVCCGRLWALEWAWHPAGTNLRCAGSSRICMPSPNIVAITDSEISVFIWTDEHD